MTIKELREEIMSRMHEVLLDDQEHPSAETRAKLMVYSEIMGLTFYDLKKEGGEEDDAD